LDEALQTLEPALAIFRRDNRPDHELRVLGRLGTAYTKLRQWPKAEEYHEQAHQIAKELLDLPVEGEQLAAVGYLRELLNDREGAILYYRRALHVAYQIGDGKLQAAYAVQLAEYMIDDVRTLSQAIQLLQEANTTVPSPEAKRLLSRADQRLKRSRAAGVQIPPAASSNKDFAARAYVA
jgi:tetratricopeptide (TPR) repeat protein